MRRVTFHASGLTAAALLLAGLASGAAAHVHAVENAAAAGARLEVVLTFSHGCGDQATTGLAVEIPPALQDLRPQPRDGWQASLTGGVLHWQGGEIAPDQEARFSFDARLAPDASGDSDGRIWLPTVQICGAASSRWIAQDLGADNPAPYVRVAPQ